MYQIKYDKNGNELVGKGKKVCSVAGKYQNIYINKNDTLCQSYTLLRYLGYNFNLKMTRKEIQSRMCQMYKKIIENGEDYENLKKNRFENSSELVKRFPNNVRAITKFVEQLSFAKIFKKKKS